jgi:hypothetical protein
VSRQATSGEVGRPVVGKPRRDGRTEARTGPRHLRDVRHGNTLEGEDLREGTKTAQRWAASPRERQLLAA